MISKYVLEKQSLGDTRQAREIAEEYNDTIIYPDKVRINLYYLYHYSFWKDLEIVFATVFGLKIEYAGEEI